MEILNSNSAPKKFKESSIEKVFSHIEGLEEEICRLQLKIDSIKNDNKILTKKNEQNQFNKELVESTINKFNSVMNECLRIDSEYQRSSREVHELQSKIDTLNSEITTAKMNSSDEIQRIKNNLGEEIQRIRTEKEENSAKVSNLISEVDNLNSKLKLSMELNEKTKHELAQNTAHLIELKAEKQNLSKTLDEANSELDKNLSLLKTMENEKQEQYLRHESINASLEENILALKNEVSKLELENGTSKETWIMEKQYYETEINSLLGEISSLLSEKDAVKASAKENQDQFEKSKKYFENVASQFECEISKLKEKNSDLIDYQNSLSGTLQHMSEEKHTLELKLKEQTELLSKEKGAHSLIAAQLNQREKQFSQFVLSQNQEKSKYQKIVSQLAREIQQAITLHPLNDYLSVTEKEISRLEWELKITPTLSGNRKSLETSIGMLIEQRDHLALLIRKSENLLQSKSSSLERILNSGILSETPPMPPLA
ncbi:MAG: HalX domain-containing protein [Deltaproteobacteria bacterium]|nr:HalX domain-containing protein [Deltaproteobacteria bacterium]